MLLKVKGSERIIGLENYFYDYYGNLVMVFEYSRFNLLQYFSVCGTLSEEACALIFYEIVLATKELHDKNIAHRDIKLDNIFIFKKKKLDYSKLKIRVKVADLGLATFCDENMKLTTFCGSPIYSSPEVNLGIPYNGFKYDIWCLGIVLYYIVYEKFPFNVDDTLENSDDESCFAKKVEYLYTKIRNDSVNLETEDLDISNDCKDLIKRMLEKNPNDRLPISDILQHPWIVQYISL